MSTEIQLISDADGLAVLGDRTAVEQFLVSEGLESKDLELHRVTAALGPAGAAMQAGSTVAANAGRWVKISEHSAQQIKKYGLMKSQESGLSLGVVYAKGQAQGIKGVVEFAKAPGSLAASIANPAVLSGAAGLMTQLAMQQTMDDIADYLAEIDEKVDDIIRAQKDAVLADMVGVDLMIEEAMTIRAEVGRVSEVTWSKVQAASTTLASTQAYALRQLDALAEKLERKSQIGDVAKAAKEAETKVQEWLAVLARCFQLQDAMAVLELDRVLVTSPDELDQHRLGLTTARRNRLELIARGTEHLLNRMDIAASSANAKVLLHPKPAHAVVNSSNHVTGAVAEFRSRLGIDRDRQAVDSKRWLDAVAEVRDRVIETGAEGVDAAGRLGTQTMDRARLATGKFASGIAERALRPRDEDTD